MLDDDGALHNAVKSVFGKNVNILLCNWHVFRSWRRKICANVKDKNISNSMLFMLKDMMSKTNVDDFTTLMRRFRIKFRKHSVIMNYLDTYYFTPERIVRWAKCHWRFRHCKTDRNMFVESFHHVLKNKFLKRKAKKRLDDLVIVLSDVELYYFRRLELANLNEIVRNVETRSFKKAVEAEKIQERNRVDEFANFTETEELFNVEGMQEVEDLILIDLEETGEFEELRESENAEEILMIPEMIDGYECHSKSIKKKWDNIVGHVKKLEKYFYDPEVEIIIDHLEGNSDVLQNVFFFHFKFCFSYF